VILREATADDWPQVADLFLATPMRSGTSFVLDRRPDFGALPGLRGRFRTFVVVREQRVAGTVTALWRPARDGARSITVGEVIDLRVAEWARGGRVAFHLLRAVHEVFAAERVDWILCLIGKHNQAATGITARNIGLPTLAPLEDFASIHFIAVRTPPLVATRGLTVRAAVRSDASLVAEFCAAQNATERFAPPDAIPWPDPTERHRAWLAFGPDGTPYGALLAWDGEALRRLRIVRYRTADLPLRAAIGVAAKLGLSVPLPAHGEALRLWATRLVAIRTGGAHTLRALVDAALCSAVAAGRNVLQLNLHGRDPLLRRLPLYPRSTYWTTLYGGPRDRGPVVPYCSTERYYGDIARV
jgi:hypothetical protein